VDHVAVVHHVAVPSTAATASTRQGQHRALPEKALQAIVVEPHPQPVADQPRGHGVEHLAQHEAAAGGDHHDRFIVVDRASCRQRAQVGALQLERLVPARVATADQLGDPGPVSVEAAEVARPAQQQGLLGDALEMAVPALDGAVLVRDARVVAGGGHAVVRTQGLVTAGLILGGCALEITERRR
jgi:hypothetical protein